MIGLDAILAVVAAIITAIWGWYNRDKVKAKWNSMLGKGGDPQSPSAPSEVVVPDNDLISDLIDKIANSALVKRLDLSRDSIVRMLLSGMIVKLTEYIRKEAYSDADKAKALEHLKFIAGMIAVKQVEDEALVVEKPAPLPPPPAPAPPAPVDPVL